MKYLDNVHEPFAIKYNGKDQFGYFIFYKGNAEFIRDTEESARALVEYLHDEYNKFQGVKGVNLGDGISIRFQPEEYDYYGPGPYQLFKLSPSYSAENYKTEEEARLAHFRLTGIDTRVKKETTKVSFWKSIWG